MEGVKRSDATRTERLAAIQSQYDVWLVSTSRVLAVAVPALIAAARRWCRSRRGCVLCWAMI
jgi:hypothetical protein